MSMQSPEKPALVYSSMKPRSLMPTAERQEMMADDPDPVWVTTVAGVAPAVGAPSPSMVTPVLLSRLIWPPVAMLPAPRRMTPEPDRAARAPVTVSFADFQD